MLKNEIVNLLKRCNVSQKSAAEFFGMSVQNFSIKLNSKNINIFFAILNFLKCKLLIELPDGGKIDISYLYKNSISLKTQEGKHDAAKARAGIKKK